MAHPRSVTAFTGCLALSACAATAVASTGSGQAAPSLSMTAWLSAAGLTLVLVIAGSFQVHFRWRDDTEAVDLFEAALMPVIFLFSGPVAIGIALLTKGFSQTVLRVRPLKATFNVAQWTLATAVGSIVFDRTSAGAGASATALSALLLAMVAVMAVNHLSVAAVLALVSGRGVRRLLTDLRGVVLPIWVVGGAANLSLGVLFTAVAAWAPLALVVTVAPLFLFHSAHRILTTARTDQARLMSLHRATAALAKAVDPLAAIPAVLREADACFSASTALVLLDDEATTGALRGLAEDVIRAGISGRLSLAEGLWAGPLAGVGSNDALVAPVIRQGETIGVLFAFDPIGASGSAVAETAVLAAFASEIASAIQRGAAIAAALADRRLLTRVFQSTSDGIFAINASSDVVIWNPAMEYLTGYDVGEVARAADLATLRPVDEEGACLMGQLTQAIADGAVPDLPAELQITNRTGDSTWVACSYAMATGSSTGGEPMLVVTARDITQAREQSRLKDEFVAIASHELRTPATIVRGLSHSMLLAGDSMTDEQQKRTMEAIHRGAVRLSRVVTNVLAVSGVEQGALDRDEVFEVGAIVDDALGDLTQDHPEAIVTVDESVRGVMAQGAPSAVLQVLVNLVGNAAKYGGGAPIAVRARRHGDRISLLVSDAGPGIPLHQQTQIFERFHRVHQGGQQAGTGLGLFIARQLAESCGATLTVQSRPGAGATFDISLRAAGITTDADCDVSGAVRRAERGGSLQRL